MSKREVDRQTDGCILLDPFRQTWHIHLLNILKILFKNTLICTLNMFKHAQICLNISLLNKCEAYWIEKINEKSMKTFRYMENLALSHVSNPKLQISKVVG
jgi:hypothetical protein